MPQWTGPPPPTKPPLYISLVIWSSGEIPLFGEGLFRLSTSSFHENCQSSEKPRTGVHSTHRSTPSKHPYPHLAAVHSNPGLHVGRKGSRPRSSALRNTRLSRETTLLTTVPYIYRERERERERLRRKRRARCKTWHARSRNPFSLSCYILYLSPARNKTKSRCPLL